MFDRLCRQLFRARNTCGHSSNGCGLGDCWNSSPTPSATTSNITAIIYIISVLIVSYPCAIGLAVPMVVVIVGGVGARHGLIFKTAEAIETSRRISHVIFNNTGTVTGCKLLIKSHEYISAPVSFELSLVFGLMMNSKHPVARAIASHLRSSQMEPLVIDRIVSIVGQGIEATWRERIVKSGNPFWLNVHNLHQVRKILASGLSVFCVAVDEKLVAAYDLQGNLRPDAQSTISEFRKR